MRHQGAGALGQARAHGRLGLRARRGQLERRIKRGKTAENRRKIGQARHIRDKPYLTVSGLQKTVQKQKGGIAEVNPSGLGLSSRHPMLSLAST